MSGTPSRTKSVTPTVTPTPPARQSNGEAMSGEGGKRMFRRMNGEMIELPPDMSTFEAIRLEAEAIAAEKKHGKGQQPKPLKPKAPAVTPAQAADKAQKKAKPASSKRDLRSRSVESKAPKGGAAAILLAAAGKNKVAQYLATLGGPVLQRGMQKLSQLKTNEKTYDAPQTKLAQTEKAVVPPALEGQSKSHCDQVQDLGQKPAPEPKAEDASKAMLDSIQANMPQSIEDVDNFKRNGKGGHISRTVMNIVQGHTNNVTDTFGEMDKPRPPAPPTHTPEALPPEEIAPATPNMNLGAAAIAALKPEHTDMSKFGKDSDELLKKEEISQEQLDMVDSGDLAEANKDRKQLKKDVAEKPAAARKTAEHERKKVDTQLQQEEQKGRGEIKNKRKKSLAATRGRQSGAKLTMEQKRQKVTDDIKAIYDKARHKVTTRLAELETQSMKRFDEGNATASKKFEDDVKREIEAFKDQRYSGFWGWAKKAKDWLLGMDELPEVNEIFQRNKGIFVETTNKLVADITADNKKVIAECKAEIEGAKTEIAKYVKNLGPELKAEGQSAMKEMTDKLNELDKEVDEKEKELAQKLKDKQTAAIKAIDEKIEKMKEEMSGALAKLGKLLLEAAKKFFTWALQKFGYSLSEIEGIINKGAKILKAIFTKPIQFVKNLFNAADQGFSNFGKNFLTHLKNALFSWLTGSLTEVKLPESWDPKGIASVALQMVGISYQNIRKHLVKIIPEPVVEGMEKGFDLIKKLITEGPMAAWEALKDMAGELKDAFVDAVKSWIKDTIIMKAIEFVASLIIPGAGIIRAIVGIYDTIVFFIQKAKDIAQMIGNFMGSIGEIAMGNIGAAAGALENGLAQGLTLVISFLAKLIRLDGITAKIRAALAKIKDKVDGMMSKVAKWIKEKATKLWGKITGKDKNMPKNKKEGESSTQPTDERLKNAKKEAEEILTTPKTTPEEIKKKLPALQLKHSLKSAELEEKDGLHSIELKINPTAVTNAIALAILVYPGSGFDPRTRSLIDLLNDLDENNTLPGERTKKDSKVRAAMALQRLKRVPGSPAPWPTPLPQEDVAQKIASYKMGKELMPLQNIAAHEGKGHTLSRHVLNGSGEIKDKKDLALRVLTNDPSNPKKAGAFNTEGAATNYVNKAIRRYSDTNWLNFRTLMLNAPPNNAIPITIDVGQKGVVYVPNSAAHPIPAGTSYTGKVKTEVSAPAGAVPQWKTTFKPIPSAINLPRYLSGDIYTGHKSDGTHLRNHIFGNDPVTGGKTPAQNFFQPIPPTVLDLYQGEPTGINQLYPGDKSTYIDPITGRTKKVIPPPLVMEIPANDTYVRLIPDGSEPGGYSINSAWPQ